MAGGGRLRLTDEGLSALMAEINKCSPETIQPPGTPVVGEIGGTAVLDALAPVAYLTRATVVGRERAITDFVRKIRDGDHQMCVTDQALGAANVPDEPVV